MQKKRKDNQFIKKAYYQGGNTAFRKFVAENLKYPEEALKNDIEGVVHLKIDIDHKGTVNGVKIVKGIGYGCDEEAKRIIKKAQYEVPPNPKKMRVIHHKNVRIQFKKPSSKEIESNKVPDINRNSRAIQLEYNITKKKKLPSKNSNPSKAQTTSYNYTINF